MFGVGTVVGAFGGAKLMTYRTRNSYSLLLGVLCNIVRVRLFS